MDISGTRQFASSPQAIWDAFHDAATLQSCIPGAQGVSWQSASVLELTLRLPSVGPLGGYAPTLLVQIVEQTSPTHMTLELSRRTADGTATVDLNIDGSHTQLTYRLTASLHGPLAMFDGLAKPVIERQLDQFLTKFQVQTP